MTDKKYRVWYVPQLPIPAFKYEVADLASAVMLDDALASFSLFEFEHRVKPDYADMGGIEEFVDGEWSDVDDDEIAVIREQPATEAATR